MINNLSQAENGPIDVFENRPFEQLVHSHGQGKWISNKELEELAIEIYKKNGKGITINDLIQRFSIHQEKAQRRLKNAIKGKEDKQRILFTLDRKNPQQYYPTRLKAQIIEHIKKQNRLIDPTGVSYSNHRQSSHYPLHNAIENQIVQSFLAQLSLLPFQPLHMHNIHLWTIINKNHYEEISQSLSINKTKIVRERIGLREVIYKFHKKGSIEIDIACSPNPFQIETDDDVNNFFIFLGKVQYTLAYLLSDPRERIVPSVDTWILKSCDFNKDIEIKEIGQLLDLNIQIKHAGKAFRLYVKNLEDRFVLREERTMNVNKPISIFLDDAILNPFHLIDNKLNEHSNNMVARIVTEMNHRIDKLEQLVKGGINNLLKIKFV